LFQTFWNDAAIAIVKGKSPADSAHVYQASKVYAERAAWDWIQKNEVGFDITVIMPSVVSTINLSSANSNI